MSPTQKTGEQREATLSSMDLTQIKNAARELRISNPRSVLADLVEEKLRAIESGRESLRLASPSDPEARMLS